MASAESPDQLQQLLQQPPALGEPYSVTLPSTENRRQGRSAIYRHWKYTNKLFETLDPRASTLLDIFELSAARLPGANCLGRRNFNATRQEWGPYEWMTYREISERRKDFGAGIRELHQEVGVTRSKFGVGLWCSNRPEWQIVDLGCMTQSLFTVSIYETLGPETTRYIINHTSLACVVSSYDHIRTLIEVSPSCPTLKIIVLVDEPETGELDDLRTLAEKVDIMIRRMSDVEALGESSQLHARRPAPEDIATINYTSGTTGNPKGVVLNHQNAVAAASVGRLIFDTTSKDVIFSYLPLAHIYERVAEHTAFFAGAAIGYFHGDLTALIDDIKELQPTGFNGVPRIYNRFGSGIRQALETGSGEIAKAGREKVVSQFGLQRARRMLSASAPLDPGLQQLFRQVFENEFVQGYGLTETYAIALAQLGSDTTTGNCGGVLPSSEACLQSVKDMGYLITDVPKPRGELLLRGRTLFKGYYKDEHATRDAIDEDGWFHTGDIAEVDKLGRFRIIDRKKNVLKLAQGEYISPERIENIYLANCNLLAQAFVDGDSSQAFPVAILGLDPSTFAPFAGRLLNKSIMPDDLQSIHLAARSSEVRNAMVDLLEDIGKKAGLLSYERIQRVHLDVEPFTMTNGLLTPTFKLKRHQARKKFRRILHTLYEEVSENNSKVAVPKL